MKPTATCLFPLNNLTLSPTASFPPQVQIRAFKVCVLFIYSLYTYIINTFFSKLFILFIDATQLIKSIIHKQVIMKFVT